MRLQSPLLIFVLLVVVPATVAAQSGAPVPATAEPKIAYLVPALIEEIIDTVDPVLRPALRGTITPNLASVSSGVSVQLSNLPVPSPASGYRYVFDPRLGVYVRVVQSLGPILTERPETLGRDRLFFALTYQRYSFDRIDDLDLRQFRVAIPVDLPLTPLGPRPALVLADTLVHVTISQTTAHFTYGLTHAIDVSYAWPIITSDLTVSTHASVKDLASGAQVLLPRRWVQQSATGLGDGLARVKVRLASTERFGLAVATDMRLPLGDELNYHGAGAFGIKPFIVASVHTRRFSPHVNAGFQWNGSSVLASAAVDRKEPLPQQLFYAIGFDAGLTSKITLAVDVFDQWIHDGQRTVLRNFIAADGATYQTLAFPHESRHEVNAAIGLKAALPRDILLTWNLMFRLNEAGLRSRILPMIGTSVVF